LKYGDDGLFPSNYIINGKLCGVFIYNQLSTIKKESNCIYYCLNTTKTVC